MSLRALVEATFVELLVDYHFQSGKSVAAGEVLEVVGPSPDTPGLLRVLSPQRVMFDAKPADLIVNNSRRPLQAFMGVELLADVRFASGKTVPAGTPAFVTGVMGGNTGNVGLRTSTAQFSVPKAWVRVVSTPDPKSLSGALQHH
eukprot:EG_transcript_27443